MNSDMTKTNNKPTRGYGWVFYDGHCPKCSRWAKRFTKVFVRRQILTAPLQRGWVQERLALDPNEAFTEMRVLTADGQVHSGAFALVYLAKRLWWAKPLAMLAKLPGVMGQLERVYSYVARNRNCNTSSCNITKPQNKKSPSPLRSEAKHEAGRAA